MPDYTRSRRPDPEGWPRQIPHWQRRTPRTQIEAFGNARRLNESKGFRRGRAICVAVFVLSLALIAFVCVL